MTNKIILGLVAIAVLGVMSLGTVFAASGDFFNLQNNGEQILINKDPNHPAIELRDKDSDGSRPYIDFTNDPNTDYDARITLSSDNTLKLLGTDLKVNQKIAASSYCNLDRTECHTLEELVSSSTNEYNISCSSSGSIPTSCIMVCDPNYGITSVFGGNVAYLSSTAAKVSNFLTTIIGQATCVRTG